MAIPDDGLSRKLVLTKADDPSLQHIGLGGDTYTVLLSGADTAVKYCLIDMHIPPGGGPPLHRHDFEETFTLLDGEMEATFRGVQSVVRSGQTIHIPANAPHCFQNGATNRLVCCVSVRLPGRSSSLRLSAFRLRREQPRHRSSRRKSRLRFGKRRLRLVRGIKRSCSSKLRSPIGPEDF